MRRKKITGKQKAVQDKTWNAYTFCIRSYVFSFFFVVVDIFRQYYRRDNSAVKYNTKHETENKLKCYKFEAKTKKLSTAEAAKRVTHNIFENCEQKW